MVPLLPVWGWRRSQRARCSRRPNSPPASRGARSSLQGSKTAASGKARSSAREAPAHTGSPAPPLPDAGRRGAPGNARASSPGSPHRRPLCAALSPETRRHPRGAPAEPLVPTLERWPGGAHWPGCPGQQDPHQQLQQFGRRRFRPYHAVTRSGRSSQAQGVGGSGRSPRPGHFRHCANSAPAKGGAYALWAEPLRGGTRGGEALVWGGA